MYSIHYIQIVTYYRKMHKIDLKNDHEEIYLTQFNK